MILSVFDTRWCENSDEDLLALRRLLDRTSPAADHVIWCQLNLFSPKHKRLSPMMANPKVLALVAFILAASDAALCSLLLPEQFHCTSEVGFIHQDLNEGDTFFIDEYVDRPNRRSSLRLIDSEGSDRIYYNQLFGKENAPVDRQFQQFDPKRFTCDRLDIYGWHLDFVRKMAIAILPTDHVSPRNVDIAIGPSGLLYAVESRMDELQYRGSLFDKSRLALVDVFEVAFKNPYQTYVSFKDMLVQVAIFAPKEQLRAGKQLVIGTSLAEVAKLLQYKLTIVTVRVCSVNVSKIKLATNFTKPYTCGRDILRGLEQDLVASFDLFEDLKSDSLIGQPLEKAGQFDFDMNPFAQPAGYGCGKQTRATEHNQAPRSAIKTFKAPGDQFSAEYFALKGSQGLAYVAYDGRRQAIRHDREGRKNIYDLRLGRSYHLDRFHTVHRMFDGSWASNCVGLHIGDDMLLGDDSTSTIARLLGIDSFDEAIYIGSKTIGDETLSVYELELQPGKDAPNSFNLPIIMEPVDFVMPFVGGEEFAPKRRRYFITYHVMEIAKDSSDDDTIVSADDDTIGVKIPRFVELWELLVDEDKSKSPGRQRSLINLLEFTQFSWSLTIEPEEEGGNDLSRLFNIESCAQERADQLMLSFYTIDHSFPSDLIQANKQAIRETFHAQLTNLLDIPPLNLLSLEVHFSGPPHTGTWLVRAKIAELVQGLEQEEALGYLQFGRAYAWLKEAELFKGENRHSLDQCKLDSVALKQTNTIVFCRGLAMCLCVKSEAINEHRDQLNEKLQVKRERDADEKDTICEVHSFTWRPVPSSAQEAVLPRVFENRNRIQSSNFAVDLEPLVEEDRPNKKHTKYQGFGHGVKVQLLDDTIGRAPIKSPLSGLRYLAASEEEGEEAPGNSNYAHKLTSNQQDTFRECHMACQMDEFCESFSACKTNHRARNQSSNQIDCVLSTMRLTQNKLNDLTEIIKNTSAENKDSPSIEVADPGSLSSFDGADDSHWETYKFHKEPGCNLHPKDILLQFKVGATLELPLDLDSSDRDLIKTSGADVVSLAECAGIANEAALIGHNSPNAEFVYCPLESLCLTSEQSLKAKSSSGKSGSGDKVEKCFTYTKSHHMNFYDKWLFRKVALGLIGNQKLEDDEVQKIGRTIVGLSLEQCARDCNLQQSNCLAFDVCEFETNGTVCTLYSIRSPLAPKTRAGLLPLEERFYAKEAKESATLVESRKCAHFYLKDAYFQLKINQLLEGDSQIGRQKLNDLEEKILTMDSRTSDALMLSIVLGLNGRGAASASGQADKQQVDRSAGGRGLMIHLVLIISSATLGALAFLYGGEACTWTVDTIEYLRARRGQRFGSHRISQLNLPNNQDL